MMDNIEKHTDEDILLFYAEVLKEVEDEEIEEVEDADIVDVTSTGGTASLSGGLIDEYKEVGDDDEEITSNASNKSISISMSATNWLLVAIASLLFIMILKDA